MVCLKNKKSRIPTVTLMSWTFIELNLNNRTRSPPLSYSSITPTQMEAHEAYIMGCYGHGFVGGWNFIVTGDSGLHDCLLMFQNSTCRYVLSLSSQWYIWNYLNTHTQDLHLRIAVPAEVGDQHAQYWLKINMDFLNIAVDKFTNETPFIRWMMKSRLFQHMKC